MFSSLYTSHELPCLIGVIPPEKKGFDLTAKHLNVNVFFSRKFIPPAF